MSSAVKKREARWPVIEIFGPTVQGEGVDQGVVSHFVRFGGCDFRCDWCDTPYAVIPAEVRKNARKLPTRDIAAELDGLGPAPWIVLTGGNPALHDLAPLVRELQARGYLVAVETQGSRWRDWMRDVDRLCISPKPPSSKQQYDFAIVQRFLEEGMRFKAQDDRPYEWMFLKVPIFNDDDLDFAERLRRQLSDAFLYLSAGNDAGRTVGHPERRDTRRIAGVRRDLMERSRWLVEEVFKRPALCTSDVIIQSQYHVLLWGNEAGR